MPNNPTLSNKQNISDKPCSRREVKETVLSLFKSKFDSINSKIEKDSIDEIFSTPVNANDCNCEGIIYYYERSRELTTEQNNQLDKYRRLIHGQEVRDKVDSEGIYVAKINQILDNRKKWGWGKPVFSKQTIKYEVKISDDGKTYVQLSK